MIKIISSLLIITKKKKSRQSKSTSDDRLLETKSDILPAKHRQIAKFKREKNNVFLKNVVPLLLYYYYYIAVNLLFGYFLNILL